MARTCLQEEWRGCALGRKRIRQGASSQSREIQKVLERYCMTRLALPHAFFVAGVLFPMCIGASQSAIAQTANTGALSQQQRPAVKVTIKGTVNTREGIAAPGAALRLLDVTSGRAWDTATDHEGKFTARDLPPGHYYIEAHQLGLGTAVWENDIYSSSPGAGSLSVQIEL